jgi:hypothetical protein
MGENEFERRAFRVICPSPHASGPRGPRARSEESRRRKRGSPTFPGFRSRRNADPANRVRMLGSVSFRQTAPFAKFSAFGDDFPPDCLLAGTRQSLSSSPRAHTALEDKEKLAHPTRFERVTFAFGGQRPKLWRNVSAIQDDLSLRTQALLRLIGSAIYTSQPAPGLRKSAGPGEIFGSLA